MPDALLADLLEAFHEIHGEVRSEGSEFDFRYSLVDHLFTDALGWSRQEGEGHVNFEDDRKDVLCYDDSDPPFPVIVCETKRPSHDLGLSDVDQLETYMVGVGSAEYGILTNGHEFRIYEYSSSDRELSSVGGFSVDDVAEAESPADLGSEEQETLGALEYFHHDRFTNVGDADYFQQRAKEVPVQYQPGTDDEGYELFLEAVKQSLDELSSVMARFFDDYRDRPEDSYPREFLDTTFPDWKSWREYTGKSDDAKQTFCRETAYILLNRALFARIAEDKEIVGNTRLSGRGMADALGQGDERPYLEALMDTYDRIDDHYGDLYELGIFDWWWVSRDKRQRFDADEERRQEDLEDDLDYRLGEVFKRLNRFDFEYVNRDILGHVYEDYLPQDERKELGEYYTPIEVIRYMLDETGYKPTEGIGRQKILDPACGSGGFLTEACERLIQHYIRKFGRESVHYLDAEEARTILERIEDNLYGIDINPFAVHITQINLLFRTVDLYDKVTEQDPSYTMDGFEIHVADTLTPTVLEKQEGGTEDEGQQSQITQFANYNGRAQAFIDDRDAVDRIKDEIEFDVVVANPPYVRTQNISGPKEEYAERYSTVESKSFDIYVPFIERGLEWLTDDGSLSYICPNRLLTHEYAESVREHLADEPLTHLIDFKDVEVFDAATPYPCIVSVDRDEPVDRDVHCARFAHEREGVLDEIYHLEDWETPEDVDEYDLFTYPKETLREDNADNYLPSWKPMPMESERRVFESIRESSSFRLQQVSSEVFVGIQTSANPVYLGFIEGDVDPDDGVVQFRAKGDDEAQPVEKSVLRRLLRGPEIDRWGVDWEGLWLIFPYDADDGDPDLLSEETLRTDYEHTWEFLQDHKSYLQDRDVQDDHWWAFGRRQNIDKMEPDKIMTNIMSSYSRFVADTDGEYYFLGGGNAGGYGVQLMQEYAPTSEDHLYYVALLNSSVLEFYHKHIAPIFGGKYYSYNKRYLEPHPVVVPDNASDEAVEELAEQVKETREQITDLEYRTDDVRNYLPDYDRDSSVLDLAQSINLDGDDYRQGPIRKDVKMDVETAEEVYQVVMKRSHEMGFESELVRDFVFELLTAQDRRLTRSEILGMDTPTRDDVVDLMEEYRGDEDKIEELNEEFDRLRGELDETILSDVYELSEEDAEVVDEFLKVW
ncbi:Eco57I restriction-modification methylase domain-containing protein [Halobaculum magnesiiphilum]|uniref:site-specific DNA-methyltransferase (adenine-specific) n=1 Tax=Halobaculum magnesiiphilum TaxID=1017351 RepID=A0A8T8WFA6_9EURY|nr:N-6 DNA methylase [Halobaculum magnesiiphilum]QZP38538.1 N-6 DNA methylase [Halobaculum magnesiiphilum]